MYALLILDMQVGLVHGPEKPWRCEALLETLNSLMDKARHAGAPIFLARHIGPVGSPIEPGSPLTKVVPQLKLLGGEGCSKSVGPTPLSRPTWLTSCAHAALAV